MSPILASVIVFACVLGGAFLGMFLRNTLPKHHLSEATKDVVKLGTGLIGTITGLVLGLLIASANSTFETQSSQVQQLTSNIVVLETEGVRAPMGMRRRWACAADEPRVFQLIATESEYDQRYMGRLSRWQLEQSREPARDGLEHNFGHGRGA